jgi:energy-coupling factor transport system permease protein
MEDALERSLRLAAAMDSRGYGRTGGASRRARQATGGLLVAGMGGLCLGAYGLLDGSAPGPLGLPALVAGSVLCCLGLALGSRRVGATQYRPDPWKAPEWIVAASGLVPAVVLVAGAGFDASGLNPSVTPLAWPSMPLVPALAIAVAAVAAVAAPPPVRAATARGARPSSGGQPVAAGVAGGPHRIDVPA